MSFGLLARDMFRPGCRSFCAGVLLLAAAFCPGRLSALDTHRKLTQYLHRTWQTEQGFADVQIDSLTQTRDGYLWLGTYTGLVRFDGVRFTAIAGPKRVLDSVWVRSVVEDAQVGLWIGTNDAGLIRLQNGAVTQYSVTSGLPSNLVFCVIPTPSGEVWACTGNGMARISNGKINTFGVRSRSGLTNRICGVPCSGRKGLGGERNLGSQRLGRSRALRCTNSTRCPRILRSAACFVRTTERSGSARSVD